MQEEEELPLKKEKTHFTVRLTELKPADKVKLIKEVKNFVPGVNLVQVSGAARGRGPGGVCRTVPAVQRQPGSLCSGRRCALRPRRRHGQRAEQEAAVSARRFLESVVPFPLCCSKQLSPGRGDGVEEEAQNKDLRVLCASLTVSRSKSCCELSWRTREQPELLVTAVFGLPSPKVFCFFKVYGP